MVCSKHARRPVTVAAFALCAGLAAAQPYPAKVVRIQTTEAGGYPDAVARLIAQGLSPALGQPVVIENRPGPVAIDNVLKAQVALVCDQLIHNGGTNFPYFGKVKMVTSDGLTVTGQQAGAVWSRARRSR